MTSPATTPVPVPPPSGLGYSASLLESILNYGLAYICVKDREGRFTYINDLDASLYNAKPSQMIGKTVEPWVGGDLFRQWQEDDLAVMDSGRIHHGPVYPRTGADQILRWLDTVKVPIRVDGRPMLLVIHRDVSAIKTAEEERDRLRQQMVASQKMEVIGQLAGSVAHDFNNLLTIVLGSSRLLAQKPGLDPESTFLLESIANAATRASELVTRLLVLDRKDPGAQADFDLNQLLLDAKPLITSVAGEMVSVQIDLERGPTLMRGNASLIQHALMNLVLNARDAMPKGGKLLLKTAYTFDEKGRERVNLEISDTGCGMDNATRGKALDPFFTTKPVGQGSGLGLVVVQRIVEQHEGTLRLESAKKLGTSCFLDFPRLKTVSQKAAVPAANLRVRLKGKTVLLAEDETMLRNLVSMCLTPLGAEVIAAPSADEAWRLFQERSGKFDCLISDVVMPGELDGVSLRRKIFEAKPGIPAILMSGYSFEFMRQQGPLPDRTEFLAKPFVIQTLLQTLFDLLEEKPAGGAKTAASQAKV